MRVFVKERFIISTREPLIENEGNETAKEEPISLNNSMGFRNKKRAYTHRHNNICRKRSVLSADAPGAFSN